MKTKAQIEAAICDGVLLFEKDYMGRRPKAVETHLVGELLIVRLKGVLTTAEQQLAKTLPPEKARNLLKQVRTQLIETARPLLEEFVTQVTGLRVVSLHHDISVRGGEEIVIFTLAKAPDFGDA